jgi:hypothetical protein
VQRRNVSAAGMFIAQAVKVGGEKGLLLAPDAFL